MPSHRAAGVTIVTDDLQHAARHAAPTASAAGGGGGAPRVVQPKWIFDQICPSARADMAPEVRGSRPEGAGGSEPRVRDGRLSMFDSAALHCGLGEGPLDATYHTELAKITSSTAGRAGDGVRYTAHEGHGYPTVKHDVVEKT